VCGNTARLASWTHNGTVHDNCSAASPVHQAGSTIVETVLIASGVPQLKLQLPQSELPPTRAAQAQLTCLHRLHQVASPHRHKTRLAPTSAQLSSSSCTAHHSPSLYRIKKQEYHPRGNSRSLHPPHRHKPHSSKHPQHHHSFQNPPTIKMRLTLLPILALASLALAAPQGYGSYGDYPAPAGGYGTYPAPAGGYGDYTGAPVPAAPAAPAGGYGTYPAPAGGYGSYPAPAGGYGAYPKRAVEWVKSLF
jgi:hypothetical protein